MSDKLTNSEIDEVYDLFKVECMHPNAPLIRLCAQARLANAQGEAVAGVPVSLINAMAATFECYALTGMEPKFGDGTKTPNAINCGRYAKQLNEILASVGIPSAPMPMSDATVESIMRQVDIVVANTQKLTEAGLNVQFAQGAYKELERQIADALRAHMGRKS